MIISRGKFQRTWRVVHNLTGEVPHEVL